MYFFFPQVNIRITESGQGACKKGGKTQKASWETRRENAQRNGEIKSKDGGKERILAQDLEWEHRSNFSAHAFPQSDEKCSLK